MYNTINSDAPFSVYLLHRNKAFISFTYIGLRSSPLTLLGEIPNDEKWVFYKIILTFLFYFLPSFSNCTGAVRGPPELDLPPPSAPEKPLSG